MPTLPHRYISSSSALCHMPYFSVSQRSPRAKSVRACFCRARALSSSPDRDRYFGIPIARPRNSTTAYTHVPVKTKQHFCHSHPLSTEVRAETRAPLTTGQAGSGEPMDTAACGGDRRPDNAKIPQSRSSKVDVITPILFARHKCRPGE